MASTPRIPIEAPFAASFPLPFRVMLLISMGILGWATNLHGLHLLGIPASSALELRARDDKYSASSRPLTLHAPTLPLPEAYRPVYGLFRAYALWTFSGWILFRLLTGGNMMLVDQYKFVPAVAALVVMLVLVCPVDVFHKRERDLFLLAVKRCCFAPASMPVLFADVVLADTLTSFAKVIGDVWLSLCMLAPGGSLLIFPSPEGWQRMVVPILMSVPYIIRFRQCIIEYIQPLNESKRPFYNALKYASSFPVIFLSAAQRTVVADMVASRKGLKEHEHPLFRLWLLSVGINTLYSFWWDVTNDWGFEFLRPRTQRSRSRSRTPKPLVFRAPGAGDSSRSAVPSPNLNGFTNGHHPTNHDRSPHMSPRSSVSASGSPSYYPQKPTLSPPHRSPSRPTTLTSLLRSTLLFPPVAYPLVIAFNLLLRLAWSLKLSSHLNARAGGGALVFAVEAAEVVRRWVWVFLRVEWECVRKGEVGGLEGVVEGGRGDGVELDAVVFDSGEVEGEKRVEGEKQKGESAGGDYV